MHPCEQEPTISNIQRTLDRMEKTQERVVDLLEQMANHDARLDHLEEHAETCFKNVDALYSRVRDLELNQAANGPAVREQIDADIQTISNKLDHMSKRLDRIVHFYELTTSKKAMYLYGGLLVALGYCVLSSMVNHWEWTKSLWSALHG